MGSRAGKTTIFNLIFKLYTVKNGEILIDDININDYKEESLIGNISVTSHEPYMFDMSIKENIKIVNPTLSDKKIKEICKMETVKNINTEYTILILAHRLSTIIDCDKILVLNNGQVAGFDTHDNLIKNNKIYQKLYRTEYK